jgi:glycosyltransferase 2 family protein
MLNVGIIRRTVRNRMGWDKVGVAVSVLIIAIAFVVLFRLLRDVDLQKVATSLRAMPVETMLTAGGFVVAGYASLTLYDFFSLRTIGRHEVPYRVAAFAGFTSYAIGHNLGATVFTAGAVRYRIYSAWDLGIVEIAKIAFVTGLTFWLGNAFVLGISMAIAPEAASAVNQLAPWVNQAIAFSGLAVIVGYLLWLLPAPRVIGRDNWKVTLPNASLTLVQIGIGILDLGFGALAMYTLLPAHPSVDFLTVLVTFVMATLLGFLSHAPGSLGVLDAAMLIGLSQFEKEELLASLVIFRALYFVLPFCVAILMLGAREIYLAVKARS